MHERRSLQEPKAPRRIIAPDTTSSATEAKRFSVQIDRSETSGELAAQIQAGAKPPIVLGLSPTSSSTNHGRLKAILEFLLPLVGKVTILDGSWFYRWDSVVFDQLSMADATERSLVVMRRLDRRVRKLATELDATDRVTLVPWPETHYLQELAAVRADLVTGSQRCPRLAEALRGAVTEYLSGRRKQGAPGLSQDDHAALLNYVVDEVSTFVHLALRVSPFEVYPGPDLPLMRRIAAGEFRDAFPYNLSRRSHLSLELIEHAAGSLRAGAPSDWPEIERLIRAWPTHFVEAAIPLAREDFRKHHTTLCDGGAGEILGFMIWRTDGHELELLWMAIAPSLVRRGIGRSIVKAVLCHRSNEKRVFGRTATTDSSIPDTAFRGSAYLTTLLFFQGLGFRLGTRHERYWGPENHMIEIEKLYDHRNTI